MGPLTIRSGVTGCVVAWTASRLNGGCDTASTAASSTGKYSGRQPAMTALMASFSIVASPWRGGRMATTSRGSRVVCRRNSATRPSVGGMIGRPSVHPRST